MAVDRSGVDIGAFPELLALARRVRATRKARVLRNGDDEIARLVPLGGRSRRGKHPKSADDYAAFLSSAGAWSDVDVDALVAATWESRDRSLGRTVDL